MDKIALLNPLERRELFQETAARKNMSLAIIEKDFWVCWVLGKIYATPALADKLIFKGGTSLSKVYGLIERFSEDIDLILDWNLVSEEQPPHKVSKSAQEKLNKQINARACNYISDELLPQLQQVLQPHCRVQIEEGDESSEHVLQVDYPSDEPSDYLRPAIRLEVGPLAAWLPQEQAKVSSYAAEEFPQLFDQTHTNVKVICARRTFWEKATILHHEANRPQRSASPTRYSRHYYDLYCMANSPVLQEALNELKLLRHVVEFKKRFYPRGWAKYDQAAQGELRLIPPQHIATAMAADYLSMQEMMFGDKPDWEQIITSLQVLESQINNAVNATLPPSP